MNRAQRTVLAVGTAAVVLVALVLVLATGDDHVDTVAGTTTTSSRRGSSSTASSQTTFGSSTSTSTATTRGSATTHAPVGTTTTRRAGTATGPRTTTTRTPTSAPPTTNPPTTAPAPPYQSSVEPVTTAQLGASWHDGCPVGADKLRMVTVSHWGFDGAVHSGRLVVHVDHAAKIVAIFHDIYDQRFAIQKMVPIDAYGGSDDASMNDNNTSAFNCRAVTGGSSWSEHSYGWAVDVNPVQNPYVKGSTVLPESGRAYTNRSTPAQGKIRSGDGVVQAFAARGWSWGGSWSSPKDYQHFSATGH
jgi:hypothetical protein